jgi:two-component system LytT family response regulator
MKCIVIDDDKLTRITLAKYIQQRPDLKLLGEYEDTTSSMAIIKSNEVDLIFLDVVMPNMTGIELLKHFKVLPQVIIISDYKEYAADGFNYNVTDFLTKPITKERFSSALDKALQRSVF